MTDRLEDFSVINYVLFIEYDKTIKKDKYLLRYYNRMVEKHNTDMINDRHYDSGFDISTHDEIKDKLLEKGTVELVPLGLKCACYKFYSINPKKMPVYSYIQESIARGKMPNVKPSPFTVLPRSSMWKSGLMLANSKGVIDAGYRGYLFAPLYSFMENARLQYKNKYLQICMPGLEKFLIKVVPEIKINTKRGKGGCGSTGK